jgi:hypothetical protein
LQDSSHSHPIHIPLASCHSHLTIHTSSLAQAFSLEVGEVVPFKTQYIFGVSEWEVPDDDRTSPSLVPSCAPPSLPPHVLTIPGPLTCSPSLVPPDGMHALNQMWHLGQPCARPDAPRLRCAPAQLFWPLTHGGTLAIVPPSLLRQPATFATALLEYSAAVAFLIPSHLDALLPALREATHGGGGWVGALGALFTGGGGSGGGGNGGSGGGSRGGATLELRHVVCCGEALSDKTVHAFHAAFHGALPASCELHNVYGPTDRALMTWLMTWRDDVASSDDLADEVAETWLALMTRLMTWRDDVA